MSLLDQILGPLEIALNRALSHSPEALAELDGERDALGLYMRDLAWGFRLYPVGHGVQLLPGNEASRAQVSTSLVGLARLMAGEDPRTMGDALRLEGDAEYAERIVTALRSARIDLQAEIENLLAPLGGAQLATQLGQGLKQVMDFGRQGLRGLLTGAASASSNAASAIPEQDAQLADAKQTREWMDQVDESALTLDRLEARISRLEKRRATS